MNTKGMPSFGVGEKVICHGIKQTHLQLAWSCLKQDSVVVSSIAFVSKPTYPQVRRKITSTVSSGGVPVSQGIEFTWDLGVISNSLRKKLIAVT